MRTFSATSRSLTHMYVDAWMYDDHDVSRPGSPSLPSDVGCGHKKMGTSSLASGRPMPATPVTGRPWSRTCGEIQ